MKIKNYLLGFVLGHLILTGFSLAGISDDIKLGDLTVKDKGHQTGLYCNFKVTSGKQEIPFAIDVGSHGEVMLNGKHHGVTLYSSDMMRAKKPGDTYSYDYRGKNLKVVYHGKRTNECPKEKPHCGQFEGTGSLEVKLGKLTETVTVNEECLGDV